MQYQQIIAVDTETAGFGSAPVIEIGACKMKKGDPTRTYFNAIVKYDPLTLPHFEASRKVHGITPEMLLGGILKAEAFLRFFEFLEVDKHTLFVGHNSIQFDNSRLNEGLVPHKFQIQNMHSCDTMLVLQNELKYGKCPTFTNLSSAIQRGVKTNLAVAAQHYGVEHDTTKAHRAEYDAELSLNIFFKQKIKHAWQL